MVSSLNKDHILTFYNDFRAVDVAVDEPLPGLLSSTSGGGLWNRMRGLVARLLGRPPARRTAVAAHEAGIGMSVSYDGGLTWTGGFMPGLPFDTTPGSKKSPGFGLEGMSDPVAIAAPCGRFYVAYLAFSRATGTSKLLVARFQDLNDHDVRHTIKYLGTSLLATGQAPPMTIMTGGGPPPSTFVDKPEIALKLTGKSSCSAVTEDVYVTFTKFVGEGSAGSFKSEIQFAKSQDLGRSWSTSKINDTYQSSQGTAMAVHPTTGLASVFWRSFNTPDTIVMRRSTSTGGWSTPVDLLKTDSCKTLAKFDQPSVSTLDADEAGLAFRTNAFPDAAITPDGSLMIVVWHERVNASGDPDPAGSPKIVWKYSKDGGNTWSARKALAKTHPASASGLGFFNPTSATAGPQVMPSVSCGAGTPNRCVVTYYESRNANLASNGWIGGYDRILDLRAVVIDATTPNPAPQPSFQVSRYDYRPLLANEAPQETLPFVQPICPGRRRAPLLSRAQLFGAPPYVERDRTLHGRLQRRDALRAVREGPDQRLVEAGKGRHRRARRRAVPRRLGRQPEHRGAGAG